MRNPRLPSTPALACLLLLVAGPGTVLAQEPPPAAPGWGPWVTLLCRYPEGPAEEVTSDEVLELLEGSDGVFDFYEEVSYGAFDSGGSVLLGPVDMPHPYDYYIVDGQLRRSVDELRRDCIAAGDDQVHYPDFYGINVQMAHGDIGGVAAHGGHRFYALDGGPERLYGNPVFAPGVGLYVYAHEMGHGLVLGHSRVLDSLGNVVATYSEWDVMGRRVVHPGTGYKHYLGWLPEDRVRTLPSDPSARVQIYLERVALPGGTGFLTLRAFAGQDPEGRDQHFTVEARKRVGWDTDLPGEGVLVELAVPDYPTPARYAYTDTYVLDGDQDGDGRPADGGEALLPGGIFTDRERGFFLRVDSAAATGYHVTTTRSPHLDVVVSGPGGVRGLPGVGECRSVCFALFDGEEGAAELTAHPDAGFAFAGWQDACRGTGLCEVAVTDLQTVSALFAPPLRIADDAPPRGEIGRFYHHTLVAEGGGDGIRWEIRAGELPEGLSLVPDSGVVRGIPFREEERVVTVGARWRALEEEAEFTLRIRRPDVTLAVDTEALPTARAGEPYRTTLVAEAPEGPVRWSLLDQLPLGLRLDGREGLIEGTPHKSGVFLLDLSVFWYSLEARGRIPIRILRPAVDESRFLDALVDGGSLEQDLRFDLDSHGNGNGTLDLGDFRAWWLAEELGR